MWTIEAKSHHRGTSSLGAAPPPSRLRIARRALTYASVRPSGSAARRVVIVLGLVVGSALVAASSAIHLELWSTGYRTIPRNRSALFDPGTRSRASCGAPSALETTACCGSGSRIHDRDHRRPPAEYLCRTVRLHGYAGGTLRRPIAGNGECRSHCPFCSQHHSRPWGWSPRPRRLLNKSRNGARDLAADHRELVGART